MKRPEPDCGQGDFMLLLGAVTAVVVGIAIAVLSCRGWKW